jgi:hypothetical protein
LWPSAYFRLACLPFLLAESRRHAATAASLGKRNAAAANFDQDMQTSKTSIT